MPLMTIDEVVTEGHIRFWLQFGAEVGAAPTNEMLYAGTDTQYLRIGEVTAPVRGDITPINVPDPHRLKRFRRAGKMEEPPDLPTFPVAFLQKHGSIPRQLYNLGDCPVTLYRLVGTCKDLGDFEKGWTDYVLIHSNAIATERTLGGVGAFDSDDQIEDEVNFTADAVYPVGRLSADVELDEATYASVTSIDAVYGTPDTCSSCREGTEHIYAVGSNGTSHNVYYTLDSGATWNVLSLEVSATTTPTAITIAGNYLIVTYDGGGAAKGGYFLSVIDSTSGIPGTATKIDNGFVVGEAVNDVWALSPRRVFFAADAAIYKSVNLANGATVVESSAADFLRIDGVRQSGGGSVIVAGDNAGGVAYSLDDGETWTDATSPGGQITAIAVLSDKRIWVATDDPTLQFTSDLGQTWTDFDLPQPDGAILSIVDIIFATDEVGYITAGVEGTGAGQYDLYATINGGEMWTVGESRFTGTQHFSITMGRIAVPESESAAINANNLLAAAGADGLYIYSSGVK
jgi:photosystem II stability/assembly factor-like uncharacterized protein